MAWVKKKPDPISDRARALNEEIAALESQIKQLNDKRDQSPPPAKFRSTANPHSETTQRAEDAPKPETPPPAEPIFEEVDQDRLKARGEVATPDHYNEL